MTPVPQLSSHRSMETGHHSAAPTSLVYHVFHMHHIANICSLSVSLSTSDFHPFKYLVSLKDTWIFDCFFSSRKYSSSPP